MISHTTNTTDDSVACKQHGDCLKARRKEAGLTQVQAANEADVVQSYYQAVESGSKPVYVHRIKDFGDFAILGTVDSLLKNLRGSRYRLVEVSESDDATCPEAGYKPFVRVLSKMLHEYSAAMDDESMDADELHANLTVLRELLRRGGQLERGMQQKIVEKVGGKQFPSLQKVRTGDVAESKAVAK